MWWGVGVDQSSAWMGNMKRWRDSIWSYEVNVYPKEEIDVFKINVGIDDDVDKYLQQANTSVDWGRHWNPRLILENTLGDPRVKKRQLVKFDPSGRATVFERRRVMGTFHSSMNLKHFPFDTQVCATE